MLRRLLIVDSDAAHRREAVAAFPKDEFLIQEEADGASALECVRRWRPECLILEAALKNMSGLDLCRRIKADKQVGRLPVLLTAATREQVLVNRALREGADDFLNKPCHPTELLWRVRGLLRRYEAPVPPHEALKLGPLSLDIEQGLAELSGKPLVLTKRELQLLELFMRSPGRVLTRRFLLESIWGYDSSVRTRVVDLCVFQLRHKLGPRWGAGLTTRRGFGYGLKF